jgi:hypothetical protein
MSDQDDMIGRITRAEFERLWRDPAMSTSRIAESCGFISTESIRYHAKAMGLPHRASGPARRFDTALSDEMWMAGVSVAEMAAHLQIGQDTIRARVRSGKVPPRDGVLRPLTLQDFMAARSAGAAVGQDGIAAGSILATKGRYAALAEFAVANGVTLARAQQLWHQRRVVA